MDPFLPLGQREMVVGVMILISGGGDVFVLRDESVGGLGESIMQSIHSHSNGRITRQGAEVRCDEDMRLLRGGSEDEGRHSTTKEQ